MKYVVGVLLAGCCVLLVFVLVAPDVLAPRVGIFPTPQPRATPQECAEWLEALRRHTATRDGVLVNQPPEGGHP